VTFRLDPDKWPNRAKMQVTTSAAMPHLIYQACLATGTISNTVYVQHAVCEALARDLNLDLDALLADLPTPRGPSKHLDNPEHHSQRRPVTEDPTGGVLMVGPANTVEEVR